MSDDKQDTPGDVDRTPGRRARYHRWLLILLSLVLFTAVLAYLDEAEDSVDVQHTEHAAPTPWVSVETLSVQPETVDVTAYAEVRPRWSAELRAAVSGRVDQVHDSALAGERVAAGATLMTIENSEYLAEMAAAELAVEEAQLVLLKAEKATTVARRQFERNGTQPPNDLALHLPQLRIAETALNSARARVTASRRRLRDATVEAPFSGFVTERFVSPGQTVNSGDALVKLVDDTTFELTAELGRKDWSLLRQPLSGLTARVLDQRGEPVAEARIRRGGGFLDEKTRQYRIFMEVTPSNDANDPALLSGDFVRVQLPGITVAAALNVAESALTQEGYLWYLDEQDRLRRTTPRVLFRRHDRIIIRAPQGADRWRVAVTPLLSFLPGQPVRPRPAG